VTSFLLLWTVVLFILRLELQITATTALLHHPAVAELQQEATLQCLTLALHSGATDGTPSS